METIHRRRSGSYMLAAAGMLLLAAFLPGLLGIPGLNAEAATPADIGQQACTTMYYALDPADPTKPNPDKETSGSFGTPVSARGEVDVKAELKERRSCGTDGSFDPALTAAHYSEWSHYGLTSVKVGDSTAEINAFAAEIGSNPDKYAATLAELEKLEGESSYSEAAVSRGVWSLYMMPDGNGGVTIKVGQTSTDGVNAVFTHGDVVVKYRLDCGFQPNRDEGFPGIDVCTGSECAPPPVCPPGMHGDWPNCYIPECPEGTTGDWPNCNNLKWRTPTTQEPGWDQRGRDNGLTDGRESARQQESGETRGNAVDDQTPNDTGNHTTTPDTKPSENGGPVGGGAKPLPPEEVEIREEAPEDPTSNQDDGGTKGTTCTPDPDMGITC